MDGCRTVFMGKTVRRKEENMFINTAIFKKLAKEAYKNQGLTVGNDGGGTFFEVVIGFCG